jgi:DNA helicase II / ATP-dependent DNA helicase PcrA
MPFTPTPEQEEILGHDPSRHARVLAGPGTGKSATLVALLNQLLSGRDAPRIKLLTFTRAATGELSKKVSEHPAAAAERPSTIHSFAISVLLRNPGTGDFPQPLRIADDWENAEIVCPTLAHRADIPATRIDRLIREMAANWESLRPEIDPKVDPHERARFVGALNEHRQIYGYTLLAELPYALRNALQDHPDLEGVDYDLLVVDEYQDLNACDLEVLHRIAERGCYIVGAGDDDQSIYSFRRAAPEGIRRFPDDYPDCADYPLSVTQRCGSRIMEWATYVIEGDPDRPRNRARLRSADGSPSGEVALLAFPGEASEPDGISAIVERLVNREGIPPSEILVLLRTDYRGAFSNPIKERLGRFGIFCSDPNVIERMLGEPANRRMLAILRLLVNRQDSLAWASLLHLTSGIGGSFSNYIYDRARLARTQFGQALLDAYGAAFSAGPAGSSVRARTLIHSVLEWLDTHDAPLITPVNGWGNWILDTVGDDTVPAPSNELAELLRSLDGMIEHEQELSRYLGQIDPLGRDRAMADSQGVRIMTRMGAKGLTVRATIIAALEEGVIPRPDTDLGEDRRLLYVAMTRSREFLYATWARRRRGPTARAGEARVAVARRPSSFVDGGPVRSEDGNAYIARHWPG